MEWKFQGSALILARHSRGLSRGWFAKKCGIPVSIIRLIEKDSPFGKPTQEQINTFSKVLDYPIKFFYREIDKPKMNTLRWHK